MFTNLEQRSWIKIEWHEVLVHKNVFRDYLREACGYAALLHRTVERWVKAFLEGRDAVQDNLRTRR